MDMKKHTALYCRFAYADTPQAIEDQKDLLLNYCHLHRLENPVFYIDSGVSGLTMDRPAFSRMMEHAKLGHLSAIVAKDASRICRLASVREEYIQKIFPSYGIPFLEAAAKPDISLMDLILSEKNRI